MVWDRDYLVLHLFCGEPPARIARIIADTVAHLETRESRERDRRADVRISATRMVEPNAGRRLLELEHQKFRLDHFGRINFQTPKMQKVVKGGGKLIPAFLRKRKFFDRQNSEQSFHKMLRLVWIKKSLRDLKIFGDAEQVVLDRRELDRPVMGSSPPPHVVQNHIRAFLVRDCHGRAVAHAPEIEADTVKFSFGSDSDRHEVEIHAALKVLGRDEIARALDVHVAEQTREHSRRQKVALRLHVALAHPRRRVLRFEVVPVAAAFDFVDHLEEQGREIRACVREANELRVFAFAAGREKTEEQLPVTRRSKRAELVDYIKRALRSVRTRPVTRHHDNAAVPVRDLVFVDPKHRAQFWVPVEETLDLAERHQPLIRRTRDDRNLLAARPEQQFLKRIPCRQAGRLVPSARKLEKIELLPALNKRREHVAFLHVSSDVAIAPAVLHNPVNGAEQRTILSVFFKLLVAQHLRPPAPDLFSHDTFLPTPRRRPAPPLP